jgi:hypothetical protein
VRGWVPRHGPTAAAQFRARLVAVRVVA